MDYITARRHSITVPSEIVVFEDQHNASVKSSTVKGTILNGLIEGTIVWYHSTGILECQCQYKNDEGHGECIYYNEEGVISDNYFIINNERVEELDDLVNEPRDESFYFTLSLYGIDKEYTIGA